MMSMQSRPRNANNEGDHLMDTNATTKIRKWIVTGALVTTPPLLVVAFAE